MPSSSADPGPHKPPAGHVTTGYPSPLATLRAPVSPSFHRIAAPRGAVCNSVGAGDSMVAGFLAGWLNTGDYAQALRLGAAAGSATAFSDGLASRAAVEELLRQGFPQA